MRTSALMAFPTALLVLSMLGDYPTSAPATTAPAVVATTGPTTMPTTHPANGEIIRLWPGKAPRALGEKPADIPTITAYFPDPAVANGTAVIVCPGGGYAMLSMVSEGSDVAKWLNGHGVAAFVLKYRITPYTQPVPMVDGQRAIRIVRLHAKDWGIDPKRIGIMGFSAGGHVASTVGTHFDNGMKPSRGDPEDPVLATGCRPDFMLLIYPVITMKPPVAHEGSRHNLLGDKPPEKLVTLYSNELQVKTDTPPAFIAASKTDAVVQIKNSELFSDALKKHKVPVELLELETGDHGYGLAPGDPKVSIWTDQCVTWMKGRGLLAVHR